jgi:hypothetical protein
LKLGSGGGTIYGYNGNIGIGTTSPAHKLEVEGEIRANGWIRTLGNTGWYNDTHSGGWYMDEGTTVKVYNNRHISTSGNVYANLLVLASDRSLKTNIEPLGGRTSLDMIMRLKPVSFHWKKNDQPDLGLLAQEVQQIFPELVSTNPDGKLSVQSVSLIAPLISAFQEMELHTKGLETRHREFQGRIAALEKEIRAIRLRLEEGK